MGWRIRIAVCMTGLGVLLAQATLPAQADDAGSLSVESAAEEYQSGDEQSTAELADAASPTEAVPLSETAHGAQTSDGTSTVTVADNGTAMLSTPGLPKFGIDPRTSFESSDVVDGAVVTSGGGNGTDLVVRATPDGVQMVSVLPDESASTRSKFDLKLPDDASVVPGDSGTVTIVAPVTTQQPTEAEQARVAAAVDAVLAQNPDSDDLTSDQVAQLDAIPPAATQSVTEDTIIATIDTPWAVDANGNQVPTHYEISGSTLTQVIQTDSNTAFPVTADPSAKWWAEKAAKCAGGVLSLAAAGYAKFAVAIAKLVKKMKAASASSALGKAYAAWKKLGSSESSRFGELVSQLKSLAGLVAKHGASGVAKHKAKGGKAAACYNFIKYGASVVASVFGLQSCYDMIKEA